MSYDKDRVSEQEFTIGIRSFVGNPPTKIRIADVDGLNVKIEVSYGKDNWSSYTSGWLQLLPDGKIKYDLYCEHPIAVAFRNWKIPDKYPCCSRERHDPENCLERKKKFERLKATGIPLFGYELKLSPSDQKSPLRKIRRWLREEGAHWDNSEPKLNFPPKQFKRYKIQSDFLYP